MIINCAQQPGMLFPVVEHGMDTVPSLPFAARTNEGHRKAFDKWRVINTDE